MPTTTNPDPFVSAASFVAWLAEQQTDTVRISLQPGQPGMGMEYDPKLPLPYPIIVGPDNRCENVPGYPLVGRSSSREELPILVGFQPNERTQRVEVDVDDWWEDPLSAVRRTPVFFEPGGFSEGMFSLRVVITDVSTH